MWGQNKKSARESITQHTLIASDAMIHGEMFFSGIAYVQGKVDGSITVSDEYGKLVVGEGGAVNGTIYVSDAVINGLVEGDLYVTHRLELVEKAVIRGNIYYTLLGMASGAQVNGRLLHFNECKQLPFPVRPAESVSGAKQHDISML